jgi:hypothetical protein
MNYTVPYVQQVVLSWIPRQFWMIAPSREVTTLIIKKGGGMIVDK